MKRKRTFKEWKEDKKEALRAKAQNAAEFCSGHKEVIIVFGPVVIGTSMEILKTIAKRHNLKEEKDLKDKYIYDRSVGHYYELKRKPKQSEWRIIDHRREEGDSYGEILEDLRLLK